MTDISQARRIMREAQSRLANIGVDTGPAVAAPGTMTHIPGFREFERQSRLDRDKRAVIAAGTPRTLDDIRADIERVSARVDAEDGSNPMFGDCTPSLDRKELGRLHAELTNSLNRAFEQNRMAPVTPGSRTRITRIKSNATMTFEDN